MTSNPDPNSAQETPHSEASDEDQAIPDLQEFARKIEELWEYFQIYLRARWNRNKAAWRDGLIHLGLGLIMALLATAALFTAVVFVFYGGALAIGERLGHPWAGYLVTGGGFLLFTGLGARWMISSLRKQSLKKKLREYEQTIRQENEKFGTNIVERAAAANRN